MIRRIAVFTTQRFLGNSDADNMEIHDVCNKQVQCQLNEILKSGNAVEFDPDSEAYAKLLGYDTCKYCFGHSER